MLRRMGTESFAESVGNALRSQYKAALATLEQAVSFSDEESWAAEHPDGAVNRVVFHTLMFADVYLDWGEDVFREQTFHKENPQLFQDYEELEDRPSRNFYAKDDCVAYLAHCRKKVDEVLTTETPELLSGDCGFPSRRLSRLELHVYNIRHIQHHAAQLGLRNQPAGGKPAAWVSRG